MSDQAKRTIADDRLGFAPHVRGVAAFLAAPETVAPLVIAVSSAWGKGKTTFMQMIEAEIRKAASGKTRFATVWFNPWKYGEESQVWAAFLDVITRGIHESIGFSQRRLFAWKMLWSNLRRKFTGTLFLRSLLLLLGAVVLGALAFSPSMQPVHERMLRRFLGLNEGETLPLSSLLGRCLPVAGFCFLLYRFHSDVLGKFNFSLLDHLRLTHFEDKTGTLAYFERDMENLNRCIAPDLKIVVFVDDLDRCKPKVLAEMIEALNLLKVSERCIFVLGMDTNIVAKKIEANSPELRSLIEGVDLKNSEFQRGAGHQFLEKILQASVNVPAYGKTEMTNLVSSLIDPGSTPQGPDVESSVKPPGTAPEPTVDSPEVKEALRRYAGGYFTKPRRLKRFVNSFRLRARLAPETGCRASVDELARFLLLTERWPGLVAYFRDHPDDLREVKTRSWAGLRALDEREKGALPNDKTASPHLKERVFRLLREDESLRALLVEPSPLDTVLEHLCEWTAFEFSFASGE